MEVRIPNKEVLLVARPKGLPKESDLKVADSEVVYTRPLPPGSVVLKVLWLSIDPYLRELMHEDSGPLRIPVFEVGKPIFAWNVSKVLDSSNPEFKEGDFAYALTKVATYVEVSSAAQVLYKINPNRPQIPLTHYLGVLGYTGFASWVGINLVTQLKHGEGIFISTAAGAVGLLVGELAKLKGCRVVGSAGTDKKVELLKEVYRFDDSFNYKKEENLELALRRCFPSGFDVYFENVGGKMLEAALEVINPSGRIVACGMISQYNKEADEFDGVRNLFNIVGKGLKMEGFLVTSYLDKWDAFQEEVSTLLEEGKIRYETHVLGRGLEEFCKALIGMLCGENIGKAVVHVNDE
ncbi:hypothetical protein L7F22_052360 [Adiantum nelumboides]|nr:hypothetical protein [Adiantum nelumboides]